MGSYIGLLLGWSFLSVLEMVIDFLDILIRKKLTVNELTVEELGNNDTNEEVTSLRQGLFNIWAPLTPGWK